jgi:hypothetical protein
VLPIVLSFALAFAALPATHARAQANTANAASATDVPALLGGRVVALATNSPGDTLATAIEGSGAFVGVASTAGLNWAPQSFPAANNPSPYVSELAWDGAGQLWAAAGGYGLWKRTSAGAWSQVGSTGIGDV